MILASQADMASFVRQLQDSFTSFRKEEETGRIEVTVKYRDGRPHFAELKSLNCRVFSAPTVKGRVIPTLDLKELANRLLRGNPRAHGSIVMGYSFVEGNLVDKWEGIIQNSKTVSID